MNIVSKEVRNAFRPGLMALGIVATFGTGAAHAQEDNRFYIAPMATYVLSDSDRHADDGVGGTLAVGAKLGQSAEFELRGTFLNYKGEDGFEDVDIAGGGFGVNLFFRGPGGPYLHADVMGGDETMLNVGLGWDLLLSDSFGIRAEALFHNESNDTDESDEFKEPLFNLGVRIPFGKAPEPPPPPAPVAVVVPPPPPPPPICSDGLDNDGDGLIDFPSDKGCESPDDGDETDPAPKCAPPKPGEAVSLEGCGVGDVIVLRGVNFDFDKATLTVNAKSILDGVASALESRPDIKVELGGHTDGKGSDSYNAKLSDRRSKSVKQYLVDKGIAADRMTTKGYGESMPVATNETDEGRELNRRVELKVTESAGGVTVASPVPAADAAAPAAAGSGSTVTIENFAFAPASITVPVGTTVVWTNQDGSNHFVKFVDAASERMKKGATYSRTFTAPGTYPYECSIHPSMTGTVVVE
jgi:outer membrane protein OmpA-like peptidoglycan-associated protein